MKPAAFDYIRPQTLEEALAHLAAPGAMALAGGHSLITDLKRRRKQPKTVVDLAGLDLTQRSASARAYVIGAMVRQADVERSSFAEGCALLDDVVQAAGDPSIRAQGTLVGALCAGETGGDWIPAALALDAVVSVVFNSGAQDLPLEHFLNNKATGQLVTAVTLARPQSGAKQGYSKVKHAAVGWSIAGLAYRVEEGLARFAVGGAVRTPGRLQRVEAAVAEGRPVSEALIKEDIEALGPVGDSYASAQYRARRLLILVQDRLQALSTEFQ